MKLTKSEILALVIVLTSFVIAFYFYPQMPERVASHWNARGQVDGYLSKFWGLFLMPLISVALWLLFLVIPKIDPKKENIAKFRKYFDIFIVLVFIFLLYLYMLTIFWNLGYRFNLVQFLVPAFAVLFYGAGVLISKAQMNWFIGIRTPWTLSSELVWQKTHQIGGKLFKLSAIISLIGLLLPRWAIWWVLVPISASVIFTVVYSYFEFQKEKLTR